MGEDDALALPTLDFEQLLGTDAAAFSASNDFVDGLTSLAGGAPPCPSHTTDDCLCHGFLSEIPDFDLPAPSNEALLGLNEPDYSKFENWIPRFVRPEKPCDYCRSKRLDCYLDRENPSCKACQSLFRECSFTNTQTLEGLNSNTRALLDTLHAVDENGAQEQGTLTGVKPLRSFQGHSGTTTPPVNLDDAPGSSKRNGIRFPKHAVKILRDWLDAHTEHPYPTEDQKVELEKATELKPSQLANWLANARRRRKVTDKRPLIPGSPSLRPSTPALPIPKAADKPWEELNPFERWKQSPPEHEPAAITDIAHAVANTDPINELDSVSPSSASHRYKRSSNESGSRLSGLRAPSTTSVETTTAHSSTQSASSAAFSHNSSHSKGSFGSFSSSLAGKRDRRRRRRPALNPPARPSDDKKRMFQCTFCTDTFKAKYDWTRHEKSLHLSLEKWICHPLGPVIEDPATKMKKCVFCDAIEPSKEHIKSHGYQQCDDKGHDARTFYRKDHLRQHLRLMHGCEMTSFMDLWKSTAVNINSRCGFCAKRFTVWQERVDHLTAHFKAGARMSEWKGCRGLDPAVAAQVTNAMPPYLIGIEAVSPNPFSASNRATWQQHFPNERSGEGHMPGDFGGRHSNDPANVNDVGTTATCWEVLTVRLGRYANEMAHKGVVLSDSMLQAQARRILYDSDDTWNQTAADNPEWLDLFKKAHGLEFIPSAIGGSGAQIPEDLETYTDLGLRIPFAVQLQAYNHRQAQQQQFGGTENMPVGLLKQKAHFRDIYAELDKQGKLHDEHFVCGHAECVHNTADISWLAEMDVAGPRHKRWCNHELPADLVKPWSAYTGSAAAPSAQAFAQGDYARARASCLEVLSRLEAPLKDDCPCGDHDQQAEAKKKQYLQRHKYELPQDRAARFETTTGAWQDSGMMPEPQRTLPVGGKSTPDIEQTQSTTTGAMMEFLGGTVGGELPFSTDVSTSTIPLPLLGANNDWMAAEGLPTDDPAFMQELDEFIASTTAPTIQSGYALASSMPAFSAASGIEQSMMLRTAPADSTMDMAIEDLNFDDMTFGTDFEMDL
ncbi:hypothetical protein BAUCODRAFT_29157 [Baudoinia panamericana UAMH 10762]|uniref:Homeobox domain-containing protein n=1 Tax=Baudoinia panamericana (strain UAMH 10762) TaxID=717646 RepID=M2MV09_BAUPA|nr:uncharacterized protein BAUCODRAFT_29157 [Baudoinia panamericana UAMH 10762]EMD00787.1 hypothetical protein BAUCODRAFT_29157 [Baudoinia panamericana UAMH 10762]